MLMRTEFRPNPSQQGMWQEIEINVDYPLMQRQTETVVREYREATPADNLDDIRVSGKMVILAQANPDLWIVEV